MELGFSWSDLTAFFSVIAIDVALAGDNAVVVGLVAAGLPKALRRRAILMGISAAALLRIAFAVAAAHLLQIVGMTMAGGLLLLWVSWKLWREIHESGKQQAGHSPHPPVQKSLSQAIWQILIADLSMSLDNVLAVAGAARSNVTVLVFGLAFSVLLMACAASLIASVIQRHRWIAYIGLAIVLYVALGMIWQGGLQVLLSGK